ncbi:CIC11C00000003162 [Sungouiella intermedia]|uniref:GPI-anchored wall transfer protein n=1 Tax=Sungouiella intermedia TaxID=45354 RepID=A0A1L0BLJ2_9ASCO|nr:CIC11C00000003162 [[Candida] intermedia]
MSLKAQKEQFVSNLSGGLTQEIYAVTGIALAGFFSHSLVKKWALPSIEVLNGQPVHFLIEFYFDVLLLLQSITIFSNQTGKLYLHALLPGIAVLIYQACTTNHKSKKPPKSQKQVLTELLPKKSFITVYRAQMMIITNLAILAVDFHSFPRRFAKVETWGTSLMDMGVGLFVFAMGLANSRSVIKKKTAATKDSQSYLQLIRQNTVKALPVLALGLIRLVSVKSLEYQEHESEYGIHWNFFMTLGLLPIVLGILDPILNYVPRFFVALAIGVIYEAVLQSTSLTKFILDPSNRRENLLTMNKEGVFSFIGYLSIFIFGQSFGSFVLTLRKTPNNLLGTYSGVKPHKWLTVSPTRGLVISSVVSFSIFFFVKESRATGSVSRRIANLPYVMWTVSYNSAFLLGYDLIEQMVGPILSSILEGINNNGLALFLVANLSTGLVNMSINTLKVSSGMSYVILIAYALTWTALAIWLDKKGIYIKL